MTKPESSHAPSPSAERVLIALLPRDANTTFVLGDLREEYWQRFEKKPLRGKGMVLAASVRTIVAIGRLPVSPSSETSAGRAPRGTTRLVESVVEDVRFAWRSYSRTPVPTAVAVATLALGIGATTAIFSVVNGVLLEPFVYPDAEELVFIWTASEETGETHNSSGPNVLDWRERAGVFDGLYAFHNDQLVLAGDDGSSRTHLLQPG